MMHPTSLFEWFEVQDGPDGANGRGSAFFFLMSGGPTHSSREMAVLQHTSDAITFVTRDGAARCLRSSILRDRKQLFKISAATTAICKALLRISEKEQAWGPYYWCEAAETFASGLLKSPDGLRPAVGTKISAHVTSSFALRVGEDMCEGYAYEFDSVAGCLRAFEIQSRKGEDILSFRQLGTDADKLPLRLIGQLLQMTEGGATPPAVSLPSCEGAATNTNEWRTLPLLTFPGHKGCLSVAARAAVALLTGRDEPVSGRRPHRSSYDPAAFPGSSFQTPMKSGSPPFTISAPMSTRENKGDDGLAATTTSSTTSSGGESSMHHDSNPYLTPLGLVAATGHTSPSPFGRDDADPHYFQPFFPAGTATQTVALDTTTPTTSMTSVSAMVSRAIGQSAIVAARIEATLLGGATRA
jgi:hypothetical protein